MDESLSSIIDDRIETVTTGKKLDVDFDNDGSINSLIELEFISGAGRGCYTFYFESFK